MLATVELLLLEWGRVRPEVGRRLMTIVTSSIHARIADELGVRYWQVKSAVDLLDGGGHCAVHFPLPQGRERKRSTTPSCAYSRNGLNTFVSWRSGARRSCRSVGARGQARRYLAPLGSWGPIPR